MTPTVVNNPHPARATKNRDNRIDPPAMRNTPHKAAAITPAVYTADSNPTPIPANTTVAAPVRELAATVRVGLVSVSVKYPVSHRINPASTTPITTAAAATNLGSPLIPAAAAASDPGVSASKLAGK